MKSIKFSAPGKLILSGEHSVVYGKKAIAIAIDLRTYCTIEPFNTDQAIQIFVDLEDKLEYFYNQEELSNSSTIEDLNLRNIMKFMINRLTKYYEKPFHEKIKITIRSEIPMAKGLGSSASFVVVFTGCLLSYLAETHEQKIPNFLETVNELAYEFEKIFHGNPSGQLINIGIDNNTCLYGNCIVFQKEHSIKIISADFLETQEIYLIDSSVPKNTKKAVMHVKDLYDHHFYGSIVKQTIEQMGTISEKILELLQNDQIDQNEKKNCFQHLIHFNQKCLQSLDLSHETLEEISYICYKHQILFKITGSGMGGFGICFLQEDQKRDEFIKELENKGYSLKRANFCKKGLIRH